MPDATGLREFPRLRRIALLALLALAACASRPKPVASEWPPKDFLLQIEALKESDAGAVVERRFRVTADGVCVYGRSPAPLIDPESRTALPVLSTQCAYRLKDECTRRLARRLQERDVLGLEPRQGDWRETKGLSLRLEYRAFGQVQVVRASGQIHGNLVRILHLVNAYAPVGQAFELPGMVGDPEPANLTGVPQPVDDVAGALAFQEGLLTRAPDDQELLLDAFALACASGAREKAEVLLERWRLVTAPARAVAAPFADPIRLEPEMLQRMLPR